MKWYEVYVEDRVVHAVMVVAEDEDEAIEKVNDGDGITTGELRDEGHTIKAIHSEEVGDA